MNEHGVKIGIIWLISGMEKIERLMSIIKASVSAGEFVKITMSIPSEYALELKNCYVRPILLKGIVAFSCTYRYKNKDIVKNYDPEAFYSLLHELLPKTFFAVTVFSLKQDEVLKITSNGDWLFSKQLASKIEKPVLNHDRSKKKQVSANQHYLQLLGISDQNGAIIPKMADKYKQINKYLEIMEGLITSASLPASFNVVDMGSGKGYLTFALYDFLKNKLGKQVTVVGIELRTELVSQCNEIAQRCGFDALTFIAKPIEAYTDAKIDILIALHACDTATDDAIYKGIVSDAALIVCAPCCHKQVRQQLKGKIQANPILKYGIFKERSYEMVTDTLRALLMERNAYQASAFEFISNEHTRKNIMLVGVKTAHEVDRVLLDEKIAYVKESYQVEEHYLESLLGNLPH